MIGSMRISVIIPCRNGERIVADAVASALGQTEPAAEVFVVDDASTDGTAETARRAGARILRTESRRNAGGARNIGLEAASGDVYAFLDADVIAPRDWLARVRQAFERDAEIVAVGGRVRNGRPGVWGDLDLYLNHSEWIDDRRASEKALIPTLAIAYRRAAVGTVRFVETNLGEDASFGAAVRARGGKLWYDPGILMTHQHERLNARTFWRRQVDCGRTIYRTRVLHDRPGRILVRFPALLFLFPHLWIVLARMIRSGRALRAAMLFPWLVAGEVARIRGFLEARRQFKRTGAFERTREIEAQA
ncbi:MAG TPA: glycosyltransferase family 2 protein [Thermoanaerobaculia bacterium]|nr:glycosyltransferase family 2 protein [Thermoanaerobaculia bacterium]